MITYNNVVYIQWYWRQELYIIMLVKWNDGKVKSYMTLVLWPLGNLITLHELIHFRKDVFDVCVHKISVQFVINLYQDQMY